MTAPTLTRRALNRATLARQMLLAREKATVLAAIERLAAIQAQWPRPPFIALWSRVRDFDPEDLRGLLRRRRVVRATMMRGTLHLLTAKDYLDFRALLQPSLTRGMLTTLRGRTDGFEVGDLLPVARDYFGDESRTFEEVRDYLLEHHPKADARAMGYAVRTSLPLVQVPRDDPWAFPATPDFALAENWLGRPLRPASGPSALVLRHLAALGPASAADVQTWTGLTGLKDVLEALRPKLRSFRDDKGRELFDLPEAPRPAEDVAAPVRFLPEFDNVLLGHQDRTRIVADAHRPAVFASGLRVLPTFLVDGFAAGTWSLRQTKKSATLSLAPFASLKAAQADVTAEAGRLVRFLEPDAGDHDVQVEKPGARKK